MQLTYEQIRSYFEQRLARSLPARAKVAVRCPLHGDKTASATVFLDGNGGFKCHACGAKGNLFQFEARFSSCSLDQAEANVAQITGATPVARQECEVDLGPPVVIYDYRDENGVTRFQKRRYEPEIGEKTFRVFHPVNGQWKPGIDPKEGNRTRRLLYNLPDLVTSNVALLCEGEKDCGTLDALDLFPGHSDVRVAATTNFEGAWQPGHSPKWLDQYSPYFAGKYVVLFEDNDDSGRAWADYVAEQVYKFAHSVRRISFPELPEKGDVTDWMQSHTEQDLRKLITSTPQWHPAEVEHRPVFVPAVDFATCSDERIDWLVEGVIQRGANGFFCGPPKGGKSYAALDMLISLALGCPWMGFDIKAPVKCGLVSREDNPALTASRFKHLFPTKQCLCPQLIQDNLYINSRQQTAHFFLDCEEDVAELIADLKRLGLELVVLDVFNRLHAADENDNTEMSKIMGQLVRIQDESGAAIGIVHHLNKNLEGNITQRLRGAGAIAGFAEWLIDAHVVNDEQKVRQMQFELKAAEPPNSFYWKIEDNELTEVIRLNRVNYEPAEQSFSRRLQRV